MSTKPRCPDCNGLGWRVDRSAGYGDSPSNPCRKCQASGIARCGDTRHGFFCVAEFGHNDGRADIPENHRPGTVQARLGLALNLLRAAHSMVVFDTLDDQALQTEVLTQVENIIGDFEHYVCEAAGSSYVSPEDL